MPSDTQNIPPPGLFLVLDGPDGGGKSTQIAPLASWLRAQGRIVVTCRDPGGTPLGDRLRAILLDRQAVPFGLRSEMLLFMASRAQLVDQIIRPALIRGEVVISDRYLLANIIYQGHAGGLGVDKVAQVGLLAANGLLPHLTLILDVPPDLARARVGPPRDRMEDRPASDQALIREGFLAAAAHPDGPPYYPAPLVLIDASVEPDQVALRIRNEVARALALHPRC